MKRIEYQPNQKINNLTFLEDVGTKQKRRIALFKCYCGVEFKTAISLVKIRHTTSCGCHQRERAIKSNTIHGLAYHPLTSVWANMKNRCYNTKVKSYKDYGGRGIAVCDEWRDNFKTFYDWAIRNGWSKGLTIDREKNNGDYKPDNCRFVTRAVNNQNKRNNKLTLDKANKIRNIKLLEPRITLSEIAKFYDVSPSTVGLVLRNKIWRNK